MLQRSEGGSTPAEEADCDDPAIALACSLESDACPAACRENNKEEKDDEVVKAGSLEVSSSAADERSVVVASVDVPAVLPAPYTTNAEWIADQDGAVSDLDTLTFRTSEEVTISKVVLENYGFSTASDLVKNVWLEDGDGNKITTEARPNNKGLTNLTMKKDYKVVDGILNATIVVETFVNSKVGGTLGFKVTDVISTAKDVDLGNYKAYKYDVVAYNGATAKVTARGGNKDYDYEAGKSYEISKFKIKAPDASAIVVNNLTLTNAANMLDAHKFLDVDSVEVTVAGKSVKATASINKDQELTVSLKDVELAAKENAEFIVSAKLTDDFDEYGNTLQFSVTKISATDKNNARISPNTDGAKWIVYKFLGGKLKFVNNKLGNVDAAINSSNIQIADGTVSVSEDIEGTAKITISSNTAFAACTAVDDTECAAAAKTANLHPAEAIEEIRLVVGNDEIVGEFSSKTAASPVITFKNIDLTEAGKVKVYVDIINDARYQGVSLSFNSIEWELKYTDAAKTSKDVTNTAGSISVSKLNVTSSKASLANSISSDEAEFKKGETDTKDIFKGTYTAKKNDINLNKFTLSAEGTKWSEANGKLTAYLYLGDDKSSVADAQLSCTAVTPATNPATYNCTASDTFSNVLVKAGESINVRVEAEVDAKVTTASSVKFDLTLEGEDVEGNPNSGVATKATSKVSVVEMGTAEITVGAAAKTVLLRSADGAIAEFIVKPSGSSSIEIESVSFTKPTGIACSNLKLDGAVNEDFTEVNGKCVADGFVEKIESEGKTLKVVFDQEPNESTQLIEVAINDLKINGKDTNEKFSKAYADGIVTFSQTGKDSSKTTYKVETVKGYNGSTKVRDIHFYNEKGEEFATDLGADEVLTAGKEFTIKNTCTEEQITKMTYTVTRGADYTATVTVDHATYPDYFKTTGGDKLTVYANNARTDAACNVPNKTVVSIATATVAAAYSGATPAVSTTDLQESILVNGYNVTGTLKYVADIDTNHADLGFDAATHGHHYVALKFVDSNNKCDGFQVSNPFIGGGWNAFDPNDCVAVITTMDNATGTFKIKNGEGTVNEYSFNFTLQNA